MKDMEQTNSAPGSKLAGTAPTRVTTGSGETADANPSPSISCAQMAAWDRLWARLLRPVDNRRDEGECAA